MKREKARKHKVVRANDSPDPAATRSPGKVQLLDLCLAEEDPARWPPISACMIVRNEADNLRPCLGSLADLAREVIVVDTGSTDDTVRVATELGARVLHFPWIDDFAAARNESIRHATGEWVFWLDADDRLDPGAVAQLKNAAASGKADAYMCTVCSRKASGSQETADHIRLFRNGLGIRFTGAIHETVLPDLVRLGLRLARTDITLEHVGYESHQATMRKTARNLAIIERELARHPDRIELIFYRGQARRGTGDLEGAEADLRAYLERTRPSTRFHWTRFWAYSTLVPTLEDQRRLPEMQDLLSKALAEFPRHPHFLALLGRLHLNLGRPREALRELQAAVAASRGTVGGLRPAQPWLEMGLAEAHSGLGDKEKAVYWADQARAHAPTSYEAAELAARLHIEAGNAAEAEAVLARMLASVDSAGPWLLLSELRQKQGQWEAAVGAVQEARRRGLAEQEAEAILASIKAARLLAETRTRTDSPPEQSETQIRGLSLLARGDHLRAAECFAEAAQAAPSNPDNYRYLAVALQALGQESQAMEAWRLAAQCQAQA